jgi:UDP-N-acetyl-D-galactosamine dehydrogenase
LGQGENSITDPTQETVAIIGLGYVGLPLAVAFGRQQRTIGFDLDEEKLAHIGAGRDPSGGLEAAELDAAALLELSRDAECLSQAGIIIVVVPTPIGPANTPDLGPIARACRTIAPHLQPGTIIVFESTVYPGVTEEVCVGLLEKHSGLVWRGRQDNTQDAARGFYIGYSPERINPGDREHHLENIVKIVAGDTPETLDTLSILYESIIEAGIHRAPSIQVAEAAKVIENTQRDLNIALMNELALIFHRIGIDTLDVLEAAGTKWNFLPFRPGLVGGHCIGVDPYYLTHKAEEVGHDPQVILAGRHTNDFMGKFVAEQTVKRMIQQGHQVNGATVVILGLTFKEDCSDLRNSKVEDIILELRDYHCDILVHDPLADPKEAEREYGVSLSPWEKLPRAQALILAVPHAEYRELSGSSFRNLLDENSVLMDVKSILDREEMRDLGINLWRL